MVALGTTELIIKNKMVYLENWHFSLVNTVRL